MASHLLALLVGAGLLSIAPTGEVRSFMVLPPTKPQPAVQLLHNADAIVGAGQKCRVNVLRSGPAGTAQVTQAVLGNGDCICTVTTGMGGVNGSAENVVIALLRDRECAGAPPADGLTNQGVGISSAGVSGGGGMGAALPLVLGVAAVGGLAAGLGSSSQG